MIERVHIEGKRPNYINYLDATIPNGWQIHNAARSIWASESNGTRLSWVQKIGVVGYFYAAVDPADAEVIEHNRKQDAREIVYHTQAEIDAWAEAYLRKEYGPDVDLSMADYSMTFFMNFPQENP